MPIMQAYGALTRSVEDLVLFQQAVWDKSYFEADRAVVPMHFNELMFS